MIHPNRLPKPSALVRIATCLCSHIATEER